MKYEFVAPNIRRTVFNHLEFSNEFACLLMAFATLKTHEIFAQCESCDHVSSHSRDVCVVESNLECEIDRQYFGVGFRSKQI